MPFVYRFHTDCVDYGSGEDPCILLAGLLMSPGARYGARGPSGEISNAVQRVVGSAADRGNGAPLASAIARLPLAQALDRPASLLILL
jgi:hypothetical protein